MKKNSPISAFAMQLLRAVVAALTVVFISRWLGAEERGSLSLVLFYVNLMMVVNEYVGGSSLGNLAAKVSISRLVPFSKLWALWVCLLGCLLLLFFTGDVGLTLAVGLIAFPLSWLTIHYNLYQGFAMVYQRNWLQLLLELLRFALIAIFFLWGTSVSSDSFVAKKDATVLIYGASTIVVLLISFVLLRSKLAGVLQGDKSPAKELFTFGFWSQNGQLVQFLNYRLSLLLLSYFTGTDAASGVYSNALLIADTIWIFGNSFGSIAHMRMLQTENKKFFADITLRYAVISIVATTVMCVVLLCMPDGLYTWVFGDDFELLGLTARWLIPAIIALGASTLFSHYLHATNQFRRLFFCNLCGLLLQVILAVWLIPIGGLQGACIAANAGFMLIFVMVFYYFRKDNPDAKWKGTLRLRALWRVLVNSAGFTK